MNIMGLVINKPGPALGEFPSVFFCIQNSHETVTSKQTVFLYVYDQNFYEGRGGGWRGVAVKGA